MNPARIIARQDAVEDLLSDVARLGTLRDKLSGVYDLERLMTKVLYKTVSPQDLKALSSTAECLPDIKQILSQCRSKLIHSLDSEISDLGEIANLVNNAISDTLPNSMKDGGYIKTGFNSELDELRDIAKNGSALIEKIVAEEKEKTGIKSLKKGYNRVFGYYIEVTKTFYDLVPTDRYIRKQTLANCERFITQELKEAEDTILSASDKMIGLEAEIFEEVRQYVSNALGTVQRTALAIASIDALASLAIVALNNNYVKPDIAIDGIIDIRNGRHPVVELMLENELFVPNNAYLDNTDNRMIILTGPNMSGKSTYMRQIALIVLMAHMGSFVPADYAKISVVDQIFTRVGASDDLSAGQSTFMVEMSEVADVIKHATKNSLVILDEVGRGTSTFDGISIAQSVAEHIANTRKIGCKTLFATHYHELIELEGQCDGVKNFSVAVKRGADGIRFLRKIVRGGVDQSYGLEVAKLAGLPESILKRARAILTELESKAARSDSSAKENDGQVTFTLINEMNAIDMLRKTNIDELSDSELRELIGEIIKYI
jgi:DNA mismatch repair protein MutS